MGFTRRQVSLQRLCNFSRYLALNCQDILEVTIITFAQRCVSAFASINRTFTRTCHRPSAPHPRGWWKRPALARPSLNCPAYSDTSRSMCGTTRGHGPSLTLSKSHSHPSAKCVRLFLAQVLEWENGDRFGCRGIHNCRRPSAFGRTGSWCGVAPEDE